MRIVKVNCGVYVITNVINGKQYVGSSKFLDCRKRSHFSDLYRQCSKSKKMQSDYNLLGKSAFVFKVIENFNENYDLEMLLKSEQHYLDIGVFEYNTNRVAGNYIDQEYMNTESAKQNFHDKMFGRKQSPEHVEKRRLSMIAGGKRKGIPVPQEMRDRISKALSGENSIWFGKKIPLDIIEKRVESRAVEYTFQTPTDGIISFVNMYQYCLQHKLPVNRFSEMISGSRQSWHGWSFIRKVKLYPK